MGAAIQDPALLRLQSLVGPRQRACGECGAPWLGVSAFYILNPQRGGGRCASLAGYPLLNRESCSRAVGGAVGPGFPSTAPHHFPPVLSSLVCRYVSVPRHRCSLTLSPTVSVFSHLSEPSPDPSFSLFLDLSPSVFPVSISLHTRLFLLVCIPRPQCSPA